MARKFLEVLECSQNKFHVAFWFCYVVTIYVNELVSTPSTSFFLCKKPPEMYLSESREINFFKVSPNHGWCNLKAFRVSMDYFEIFSLNAEVMQMTSGVDRKI